MASSPWSLIHGERAALVSDLDPLTDEQWATPSLCAAWSVRDVFGHMTATAKKTPGGFFAGLARSGFRFDPMIARDVARETAGTPAEGLAEFKRHLDATTHPPGPANTWLGEAIIHGEDIRRPLGITRAYPTDALVQVADFYKGSNLIIGAKKRISGLSLRATDVGWSTGSGPEVRGPMLSLVMAMTGRKKVIQDLAGDGVATLQSRT